MTRHLKALPALVLLLVLAYLPYLPVELPGILPGRVNGPGSMQLLGRALRSGPLSRTPLTFGRLTLRGLTEEQRVRWSTPVLTDAEVRRDLRKAFRGVHRRYTLEAAQHFADVEQPVLVLWGGTRNAFPVWMGERLADDLPNARLEVIADSSAFLSLDAPEAMVDAIDRFVLEVASSTAGSGAA